MFNPIEKYLLESLITEYKTRAASQVQKTSQTTQNHSMDYLQ